jgi:hypothetical protein
MSSSWNAVFAADDASSQYIVKSCEGNSSQLFCVFIVGLWNSRGLCGTGEDLCGTQGVCVELERNCVELRGFVWNSEDLCGTERICVELRGFAWNLRVFVWNWRGFAWN